MTSDRDRVSELESQVTELQATVRGLTEELVDANERIRELEGRHGVHEGVERASGRRTAADGSAAEDVEGAKRGRGEDTSDEESDKDDIIVA